MEDKKHKDFCTCAPEHLYRFNFKPFGFKKVYVGCCCKQHDLDYAYMYGLPRTQENINKRKLSDINLREGIIAQGAYRFCAWTYYIAVRYVGWYGLWEKKKQ